MPIMDQVIHCGSMCPEPRNSMRSTPRIAATLTLFSLLAAAGLGAPPAFAGGETEEINMGFSDMMMRQVLAADLAAQLAGRWSVQSLPEAYPDGNNEAVTAFGTCTATADGATYVWKVASSGPDLVVTQEGDGAFTTLSGYVVSDQALGGPALPGAPLIWTAVLSGVERTYSTMPATEGGGTRAAALWLRFALGADGRLTGTRRYLGWQKKPLEGGSVGVVPCFADFGIIATR